jgi:hypothetical protein
MGVSRLTVSSLCGPTSFRTPRRRVWAPADPRGDLAALARHLGAEVLRGAELSSALGVAEDLLDRGSPEACELVVSWLEDLFLMASWPDTALSRDLLASAAPSRCRAELERVDQLWHEVWVSCREQPGRRSVDDVATVTGELRDHLWTTYQVMPDGMLVGLGDVLVWEVGG